MRKYSVEEIDEMRLALYEIYDDFGLHNNHEEKLRTYMINGTEPSELQEKVKRVKEIRKKDGFYHGA